MGDQEKKPKIPKAPVVAAPEGNLLSSVAPPAMLPNFITAQSAPVQAQATQPPPQTNIQPATVVPDSPDKFSPAIPPSKGEPTLPIRSPEGSQTTTQSPGSLSASTPEAEELGDIMPGSGLLTWMKGAVSTGGLLHRVAERAKSSVDSMITTLDPQMKEYLNSGGDLKVVVASDKEVKVSPVREAFQAVFGKATVIGVPSQSDVTATQPVGYSAAYAAAKQRIAHLRSSHPDINNNVPVIAIESFLVEEISERWFDVGLVVMSQPSLGVELQLASQGCPAPAPAVAALRAATPSDYPHAATGFSTTIGSVMATNLQVHHTQWQEVVSGVSRRETLQLTARSIAGTYKRILISASAES